MNDDVLLRAFNKFAQGRHWSAEQAQEIIDFVGIKRGRVPERRQGPCSTGWLRPVTTLATGRTETSP
jgi:hypothetical protein